MKIASHPYAPNGLRARDEWGNVRCWCGHLRGVHADQGGHDFQCDLCWTLFETETALAQHKADEEQERYGLGRCRPLEVDG